MFTFGVNSFHVLSWSGRGALLYLAVTFIQGQTADYIVHFIAVTTPTTPFASPSSPIHSLSALGLHDKSFEHRHHDLCVRNSINLISLARWSPG